MHDRENWEIPQKWTWIRPISKPLWNEFTSRASARCPLNFWIFVMNHRSHSHGWLSVSTLLPRSGTIVVLLCLGLSSTAVRGQVPGRPAGLPTQPAEMTLPPTSGGVVQAGAREPALPPLPPQDPSTANSVQPDATTQPDSNPSKFFEEMAKSNPDQVAYPGFSARLFQAYFGKKEQEEEADSNARPTRRGLPAPFSSPPFPFMDHIGPNIGVNDTSVYPLMEAIYAGRTGKWWKDSRIKIYGWVDPSVNISTSKYSNVPLSYSIVPNRLELSQAIVIFERVVDSVQQEHTDWGFKFTNLYGIDYRYTTAKGYFSNQLLAHNHLYGYDPLQMYVDYYVPWIGQGTMYRFGRYISPIDIEAQLSPENYLYTHSLMYTYDPYTFTGLQQITRLNEQWQLTLGVHAGNDMAPWTKSSQANGEILLKWVSKDAKDSVYGGVDSIGKGYYSNNHDDLQVLAGTWAHKFTDKFHTTTEAYYIWERSAQLGGTTTLGPPYRYFEAVGPGAKIPGLSNSFGVVNYTAYALTKKDYIVLRNDMLADPQGFRVGFKNATYEEVTLGWIHHFTPWLTVRPEVRYDHSYGAKAYDNGTKANQWTSSVDFIYRF
jgi:Putative beta-barrel porin-2, OmpL-like. bbp2